MLCRAGFLSGVPQGSLASHMWWVWSNRIQRHDWARHKSYLHGSGDETKSSLSMFTGRGAMTQRLWVHHLWICIEKPIIGPTSSSRWTENLKPTVSWAAVWRGGRKRMNMWWDKEDSNEREREREKTRHICETKAMSCSNCVIDKSMEIAFSRCCTI